ncbi:MAG TPA: tRNA 2-thiouridine(34) synthase MnmA, partial [Leptospiraceae bacterium]|nr:tRNA 2-thiouridine(34) synthase MnmA [Leptospiraceae bacterium]
PGQSSVFYPTNGDYLLMGGIIEKGSIKLKKIKTSIVNDLNLV